MNYLHDVSFLYKWYCTKFHLSFCEIRIHVEIKLISHVWIQLANLCNDMLFSSSNLTQSEEWTPTQGDMCVYQV